MLYSPTQFQRDQLISDLLGVRAKLEQAWLKGSWSNGESQCIVNAVQSTVGTPQGYQVEVKADTQSDSEVRLGRAIVAIYMALRGPKAPTNITLRQAMTHIISFNDHQRTTHGSVVLLIDRAVALVQEQAAATVTAGG